MEMQSYIEKLVSENKRMQATNEAMSSANKELHTLNAGYLLRNKELIEINDDLNNYSRSNINSQLFINTDLLLVKFSPGTEKHINVRDAHIGRPIEDIFTDMKFVKIAGDVKEVLAHGTIIRREVEAMDGKWYEVTTMPHARCADGKTDGAIISFNDVTGLKLIQLELCETNTRLLSINADLDNFVHTASHDLLGPLANIKLSIDVMNQLEISANPQLNKFLKIINGSIKLFIELVKEMGIIGKIENEMSAMEAVDVNQMMDELTLSIENKILSTKVLIIRNIAASQIYFSKKNLRSILYNLISNSIKFKNADRGLEIKISTKEEGGYAILKVEDNGVGIPESEFNNIFKMYGRLHKDVEGQGIGLYLIRKIVNAAGGKVIVESEPGKGSAFTIYFKLQALTLHEVPSDGLSIP